MHRQGIQTLKEEIRTSAAASSQRETGLTQAFQETIASVQQQQTQAQKALADAQSSAVTTFEEIGSSLEKAVKERKPGEVELHKLIKVPDAFNPGNWQEEKSGWTEFRSRMRVALVPRYEVRPCMLALYFLGETSKVFRLVKTSKVFARKHRRCFR